MTAPKDDGGPAFPYAQLAMHNNMGAPLIGMSLRDYFAAQILNMASHDVGEPEAVAARAYHIADAMLAERSKP